MSLPALAAPSAALAWFWSMVAPSIPVSIPPRGKKGATSIQIEAVQAAAGEKADG